jgi:acetyltransferase-like isoleucine patch superfamily enzyme
MLRELARLFQEERFRRNLRKNGVVVGRGVEIIESEFAPGSRCADYASVRHSQVGELSAIGRYTKVHNTRIGKYCALSWDCTIGAVSHPHDRMTVSAFPYVPSVGGFVKERRQEKQTTEIGNDVWMGCNGVILPGLRIGDGAIIAAGAVVTKDVAAFTVMAGVPARPMKTRFPEAVCQRLLELRWWDWPRDRIERNLRFFQEPLTLDILDRLEP